MEQTPRGAGEAIVLTGPPGSGKTTVAAELGRRFDRGVHLELDAFFHVITAGYVEPWRTEAARQNDTVMRVATEAAAGFAGAGYRTVVEGVILPGWYLEPVTAELRARDLSVTVVVLRPPLEVCVRRASVREDRPLADGPVISDLWQGFDDLTERGPVVIHDAGLTIGETADEVERLTAPVT